MATKQFLLKEHVPVYGWTEGVPVDPKALEQLRNTAKMRVIHHHIAVMPDVHWGCGSTVGSVIPTLKAIIPATVGVDIGCGMMALQTNLKASDLPDSLSAIRSAIEEAVPHGRTDDGGENDTGAWGDNIPEAVHAAYYGQGNTGLYMRLAVIRSKHPDIDRAARRAAKHLGTLGTGNHFIEMCLDEHQQVWMMLHSGSRGIGNRIGSYFIEKAKKDMKGWHINLPDADLAYLPEGTQHFNDYVEGVLWAQEYAAKNREVMMCIIADTLKKFFPQIEGRGMVVNCHHNYVQRENHFGENVWLTRKGAVRAREGDLGIIPGSMGAKSFIVRGKGNPESFHSCSHGAGRVMSRGEAHKKISLVDHIYDTQGVECKKDASVIDESPKAYKPIDDVIAAQSDLVEVVHVLKQVLCVKG